MQDAAGGSETLREESVNMRLLSEYLRVHGLDFLKKVFRIPPLHPDLLEGTPRAAPEGRFRSLQRGL